jgi:hypothetical protein
VRFLFLDFDGVLNGRAWYEKRPTREAFAKEWNLSTEMFQLDMPRWGTRSIDPDAVARLNRLVRLSGAAVVVSSTWRTMYPLHKLQWILNERGFEHMLIGSTPSADNMPRKPDGTRLYRGDEIVAWMEIVGTTPDRIVILDDDSDMGALLPRLVNTDHDTGLTDTDVDRALALFEAT